MRVLILTERFPFTTDGDFRGGVEARAYFAALALAKEHEVTVLAAAEAGRIQEPIPRLNVVRCGPARTSVVDEQLVPRVLFLSNLIRTARRLKPDIIEATDVFTAGAAMSVARSLRIPAVCTYHDLWIGEWRRNLNWLHGFIGEVSERRVLRFPWTKIIAVSTVTRAKLIQRGVPPERISVVPNGVMTEQLPEATEKFERPTIISVGKLVKYKRLDDLLRAADELRETIADLDVRIVGSGPDRALLEALAERLGLAGCVTFHGFIPRLQDVLTLVAQSRVVCLPSTVEGFGLVTIEAMAVGTPYVAAEIPATAEVTHNGIGGILYPPGSLPDLVEGLRAILTDRAYGEQLGRLGRAFVLEQYSWDKIGEQLRAVYRSLTDVAL